jgi:hypothetical protein
MKNLLVICALLYGLAVTLPGCLGGGVDGSGDSTTTNVTAKGEETTVSAVSAEEGQDGEEPAGVSSTKPFWELADLDALDTLMANADGYVYYHFFAGDPAGFEVVAVTADADMIAQSFILMDEKNEQIVLDVLRATGPMTEEPPGSEEMVVDGQTYYCAQELDDDGEVLLASFLWTEGESLFIVHNTQEPITPDVIRKYSQMKKVEFNVGQAAVGYAAGTPLISDPDKIERLVRENSGITYVDPTGTVQSEKD